MNSREPCLAAAFAMSTCLDAGVLRNTTARTLARNLTGHRFEKPRRQGKWLILPTDGPTLLVHSGMTGHPYVAATADADEDHERW